ncbi:hypothetical protein BN8_05657 [Fibrisoma limi BUZ 3]|uniref:Uncharacterized protein n=1 Tax=Fibrisoma limi BUZ 3 TaxID=1185876 RepID=I2GR02_9BACT|nr:hypothetical protein BN8_05657 [Fibrisoma limi BUZ 3]
MKFTDNGRTHHTPVSGDINTGLFFHGCVKGML